MKGQYSFREIDSIQLIDLSEGDSIELGCKKCKMRTDFKPLYLVDAETFFRSIVMGIHLIFQDKSLVFPEEWEKYFELRAKQQIDYDLLAEKEFTGVLKEYYRTHPHLKGTYPDIYLVQCQKCNVKILAFHTIHYP